MDVAGFKSHLVDLLIAADIGDVYRGRPPVGKGPAISVDEAEYEWVPEATGNRGYRYRGELTQTIRITTNERFSNAAAAERSAYNLCSQVINTLQNVQFSGLNSFTVSTLEEEQAWMDEAQAVVLRLEMIALTYGPGIL